MKSWFGIKLGSRQAQAKTAGVFASACVVGLIVNLVVLLLSAMNFAPLQAIVAADDQLFYSIATPRIQNPQTLHRVVLVDIDDDAMPPGNAQAGGSTPRPLIADLIRKIREQRPAAIFLDIDLRNGSSQDKTLQDELAKPRQPPVLIPYFLEGLRSGCTEQGGVAPDQRPVLLGSAFQASSAPDSVIKVHGVMEAGPYGFISGTCSAFLLRSGVNGPAEIPAAMVVATGLAKGGSWSGAPRMVHPLWRIRDKKEAGGTRRNPRPGPGGLALYTWIPAGDLKFASGDLFKSAIVIVGASQTGSDDVHDTPVGPMIGSLIHVNLALDLQQAPHNLYGGLNTTIQILFDSFLTIVTAAAVAWFCWHHLHVKLGAHGRPTWPQRLIRMGGELLILLLTFVLVIGLAALIDYLGGWSLQLWRFAFIGSLLGGLFVVVMEVTFLLGEMTQEFVENAVRHPNRSAEKRGKTP